MRSPASSDRVAARDRGQAVVELALCLPVVMLLAMGIVQVALVARTQLRCDHAARNAARAAASADGSTAAATAAAQADLTDARISVGIDPATQLVRATVVVVDHTDVPLIGWLLPDVTLRSTVTMLHEPP